MRVLRVRILALICIPVVIGLSRPVVAFGNRSDLETCEAAWDKDLEVRHGLPETPFPRAQWDDCCGPWGAWPTKFSPPKLPLSCQSAQALREHVLAVARSYVGLPYQHHHIPSAGGLDCSNFTAWVYNFGLGISFVSNVHEQAETAGRRLRPEEPLLPGDLLFLWSADHRVISHVAIYVDDEHVIDSTGPGVRERTKTQWYTNNFSHARRVVE